MKDIIDTAYMDFRKRVGDYLCYEKGIFLIDIILARFSVFGYEMWQEH